MRSLYVPVETPRVSCRTVLLIISSLWVILVFTWPVLPSSICLGKQTVSPTMSLTLTTGYSVIDFSLVDPHYGVLQDWINLMDEMHRRGMYMIADFTVGTMGDMLGVQQYVLDPDLDVCSLRLMTDI